jgi:hypothetical protein
MALCWVGLPPNLVDHEGGHGRRLRGICGRPPPCKEFCSDLIGSLAIICPASSGAPADERGQDGFRGTSSKHLGDLVEGHCPNWSVLCRGSIDHAICSFRCKFRHQLSTVALSCSPYLADSLSYPRQDRQHGFYPAVDFATHHHLPGDASHLVGQGHGGQFRRLALEQRDEPG